MEKLSSKLRENENNTSHFIRYIYQNYTKIS